MLPHVSYTRCYYEDSSHSSASVCAAAARLRLTSTQPTSRPCLRLSGVLVACTLSLSLTLPLLSGVLVACTLSLSQTYPSFRWCSLRVP